MDTRNSELNSQKRIDAACEIFASCMVKAKEILEEHFGKPTSYYDGEKKNVLSLANRLFDVSATEITIKEIVGQRVNTEIEVAYADNETENEDVSDAESALEDNTFMCGF